MFAPESHRTCTSCHARKRVEEFPEWDFFNPKNPLVCNSCHSKVSKIQDLIEQREFSDSALEEEVRSTRLRESRSIEDRYDHSEPESTSSYFSPEHRSIIRELARQEAQKAIEEFVSKLRASVLK